jgi:hypothetical protein
MTPALAELIIWLKPFLLLNYYPCSEEQGNEEQGNEEQENSLIVMMTIMLPHTLV